MSARIAAKSRAVSGPHFASPTARPSSRTTALASRLLEVIITSSAAFSSARVIGRTSERMPAARAARSRSARAVPCRIGGSSSIGGVASTPPVTMATFE